MSDPAADPSPSVPTGRVLLIEDDPRIAAFVVKALRALGHDARWESTGTEGLRSVQESEPDLLLLDLGLPDVDGLEVLRVLRGAGHLLPVIVVTARSDPADRAAADELDVTAYLTKPFALPELLSMVSTALGSRRRHR